MKAFVQNQARPVMPATPGQLAQPWVSAYCRTWVKAERYNFRIPSPLAMASSGFGRN